MSARRVVGGVPRFRTPLSAADEAELRALVARGGVLAIPTESSYGLGADPRSRAGVDAIYAMKRREPQKPLPVVVAGETQLAALGIDAAGPVARRLLAIGPAPLTAVLPVRRALPAGGADPVLAVRVPASAVLREMLAVVGPLTATSANLAGEPPILQADDLAPLLQGFDAAIVDGGRLPGGPPSTLIGFGADGKARVLRAGAIAPALALAWFEVDEEAARAAHGVGTGTNRANEASGRSSGEKSAETVENVSENA